MTTDEGETSSLERKIEGFLLLVISVTGLVGNVSLWTIILMSKHLRSTSNGLVLCLSAADIMVCVINVPMTFTAVINGHWIFSGATCRAVGFTTMLTFIVSVMSLGLISFNRFMLICHPNKFKSFYTPAKTVLMIICTIGVSALLSLPPLVGWGQYGYHPGQSICFCTWRSSLSYTFFMFGVCFGGPCTVMTFCYFKIMQEVRRSRRRVGGNNCDKSQKSRNNDIKLATSFLVVIFVFIISWFPFCVIMIISVFSSTPVPRPADFATLLLGCANSCYNPLIYGVMNTRFRQGFKHLYCDIIFRACRSKKEPRTNLNETQMASTLTK